MYLLAPHDARNNHPLGLSKLHTPIFLRTEYAVIFFETGTICKYYFLEVHISKSKSNRSFVKYGFSLVSSRSARQAIILTFVAFLRQYKRTQEQYFN
jgi:hypothetical protein